MVAGAIGVLVGERMRLLFVMPHRRFQCRDGGGDLRDGDDALGQHFLADDLQYLLGAGFEEDDFCGGLGFEFEHGVFFSP